MILVAGGYTFRGTIKPYMVEQPNGKHRASTAAEEALVEYILDLESQVDYAKHKLSRTGQR